ncbi:hypothetical protein GH733_017440 [Mirounga leonina]|nr:hypothetical protein GH733_017440 [Mirounga leonina]
MQLLKALWALAGAALCCFLVLAIHAQFLKEAEGGLSSLLAPCRVQAVALTGTGRPGGLQALAEKGGRRSLSLRTCPIFLSLKERLGQRPPSCKSQRRTACESQRLYRGLRTSSGQLAAGTCEIVTLDRDSSQPRRTIARQTARCACRKGQIAGTTRARPACVDAEDGGVWALSVLGRYGYGRCEHTQEEAQHQAVAPHSHPMRGDGRSTPQTFQDVTVAPRAAFSFPLAPGPGDSRKPSRLSPGPPVDIPSVTCSWTAGSKLLRTARVSEAGDTRLSLTRIIKTKQWCDMLPCLEGEGCDLLINRSGWTCTQPGGRIKTTTGPECWAPSAGPRALDPEPQTPSPQPGVLDPEPRALDLECSIRSPGPQVLGPECWALSSGHQALDPKH